MLGKNPSLLVPCWIIFSWIRNVASSSTECSQAFEFEESSDTFTGVSLFQIGFTLAKKQDYPEVHTASGANANTGANTTVWQHQIHLPLASQSQIWKESPVLKTFLFPRTRRYVQKCLDSGEYYLHSFGQMADDSEAVEWWHEMARLVAAFFAVFTMCTDDLLWFMPFAISPRKYTFCVWYLIFMEITVLLSWALVGLVAYAEQIWPGNPLQLILQLLSIAFLAYYTISLAVEWYYEDQDKDDVEDQEGSGSNTEIGNISGEKSQLQTQTSRTRTIKELAFISILGNLDNFTLYIALLFSGVLNGPELIIGALLSSLLVCAICIGLSFLQIIREIFAYIPLWAILGVITIWSAARLAFEVANGSQEGVTD